MIADGSSSYLVASGRRCRREQSGEQGGTWERLKKMTIKHVSQVTDLIFVRAYHNLPGISQGEWIDYYGPASIGRLRQDVKSYVQHQLQLFTMSADYGEY